MERAPIGRLVGQAPRRAGAWPRRGGASARLDGLKTGGKDLGRAAVGVGPRRRRTGRGLNGAGPLGEARLPGAGPGRSEAVRGRGLLPRWAWLLLGGRGLGGGAGRGLAERGSSRGWKGHGFEPRTPPFRFTPGWLSRSFSPSSGCPRTGSIPGPPLQRPKPPEQPRPRRGPCPSWPYHPLLEAHLGWTFWGPFPALLLDGVSFSLAHVHISLTVTGDLSIPWPPGWGCGIRHPVTWAQSHTWGSRLDPTPHTGPVCWPSNSSRQGSQVFHLCAAELLSFSAHG